MFERVRKREKDRLGRVSAGVAHPRWKGEGEKRKREAFPIFDSCGEKREEDLGQRIFQQPGWKKGGDSRR